MDMLAREREAAVEAERTRREQEATTEAILERIVGSLDEEGAVPALDLRAEELSGIAALSDGDG